MLAKGPLCLLTKRSQNIINNHLYRRQRNEVKEQYSDFTSKDIDHSFKTYVVIVLSEKAKLQQCHDLIKIVQELGVLTSLEFMSKGNKYLYLTATTDTLLRYADETDLVKETITGSMQKFNYYSISDYLLPGMTKHDVIRYCEAALLIKDATKPSLLPYIKNGLIADMFCLHDVEYLEKFSFNWAHYGLPIDDIRNYFGSSIGLYFGFIQYYTKALIFPTLFGFFQQLFALNLSIVCSFYVIWTTVFLELWKRKCACYSYYWGTIEMTSLDKPRTSYYGTLQSDPITGKLTIQYPMRYTYLKMYCLSYPIVLLCILAAVYFALYQFQIEEEFLADFGSDSWLLYIPCVMQSILISIFSWAYEKLATFLTDIENHRTRSQYDRHRVNKLIIFEIVNNFASLFYIAFVIQDIKQLKYQLMMQFFIFEVVCIIQEIGLPLIAVIRQKCAMYINKSIGSEILLSEVTNKERYTQTFYESGLDQYQSTYEDYLQMCIQFGYVILFAAVAPFAPLGALINNIFAMHIDLFKLCYIFKRPFARRTKNIGAWQSAFELLSVLAILSNCGLLYIQPNIKSFFLNTFPSMPDITFLLFEHLLLGLKFIIHKAIHERPRCIRIALLKADYESRQAYKNIKKLKAELKSD